MGSIARSGACGGGSTVGAETRVDNELAKIRGFSEGDRRGFGKMVLGLMDLRRGYRNLP